MSVIWCGLMLMAFHGQYIRRDIYTGLNSMNASNITSEDSKRPWQGLPYERDGLVTSLPDVSGPVQSK